MRARGGGGDPIAPSHPVREPQAPHPCSWGGPQLPLTRPTPARPSPGKSRPRPARPPALGNPDCARAEGPAPARPGPERPLLVPGARNGETRVSSSPTLRAACRSPRQDRTGTPGVAGRWVVGWSRAAPVEPLDARLVAPKARWKAHARNRARTRGREPRVRTWRGGSTSALQPGPGTSSGMNGTGNGGADLPFASARAGSSRSRGSWGRPSFSR